MEWRERDGIRWLEAELPGARAAFTTRLGGTSEEPFDSLNLGALTDDDADAVVENRHRLATALEIPPDRIAFAHQVHGADLVTHHQPPLRCSFATNGVVKAQRKQNGASVPSADGQVVTATDIAALVFVADCVPVALAGPGGAAILHCGWRGLASSGRSSRPPGTESTTGNVGASDRPPCGRSSHSPGTETTTAGLIERGVAAVGATDAVIGPSIGPCCYDVGDEVLDAFADFDGVASGRTLDLPAIARALLLQAGVSRVEVSGLCTSCEAELFFSHRRDAGRTGRQGGLVWRTGGED